MGFFNKIFTSKDGSVSNNSNGSEPDIQFGRYTDRHKTPQQLNFWDDSVKYYKEGKFSDCFYAFFNYLKDIKTDNVLIKREGSNVHFEIIQGSKVVKGIANDKEVTAESEVAGFDGKPNVAVMRKLLSVNYDLFFSKFAIKDNLFTLKFSSQAKECEPTALYFSLKEVANQSDKYDDVLTAEFDFLKEVNVSHIHDLPSNEKEVKYAFFKEQIDKALRRADELDPDGFSGARSFLLLTLTFKLYYLLAPEGVLLDDLRFIQGIFFAKDNRNTVERNYDMISEFRKLYDKPKDEIMKSFYKVKATFAVVKPTGFKEVTKFIYDEVSKIDWYRDNRYPDIQQAICEYVVAYCEFYFGMDAPFYEYFDVFWKTLNSKYHTDLGFSVKYYDSEKSNFNISAIEKEINAVTSKHRVKYPSLAFSTANLRYSSLADFATSFLYQMERLNLN